LLGFNVENTVFRRYNTAVVVTFIIIVFVALAAATLRYFSELSIHKQQGLNQLQVQATQLNNRLLQSKKAIIGIQELAEYLLKYPDELKTNSVLLKQDGEQYYLDKPRLDILDHEKRLKGNITGIGNINEFSTQISQEIAMANALTPAFVTAQKVIEEGTWFYYVSLEKFVNIFPWIDRDSWNYSNRMPLNPHFQTIKKLGFNNNQVVWSSPYIDAAGKGMNASLGIGVYRDKKLLGIMMFDINLARLQQSLPELDNSEQSLILFNQQNEIIFLKQQGKEPLSYRASWQKLLPKDLELLNHQMLIGMEDSTKIGDWFIEKHTLDVNGWTLLKYQPYEKYISPLWSHFVFMFSILLVGLLAFLMLVNYMTRRSFIKPTHEFISHIEHCAEGDPGKIKPTADWLHWFVLVEDIFIQNQSLLLQLKEQNEVLDSRVLAKTQALQESSTKHQRDYVLLSSVMNAIPELIIFNDPQGKLMGCNRAFEVLSQYDEHQMLGKQASLFMPKALAKEINRLNKYCLKSYPKQTLIDAGDYSYQGYCNQFTNKQGVLLGTITILQDVTKQQATQSALEKAKNQAEYANQVKIQFLANMSHEIRTPINAMQGMIDLLSHTLLDARQQHYLSNAKTASFSLLHLIDELLDLSKIEAGKMNVVNEVNSLSGIVDKALKLNIANVHHKNLHLTVELTADVPDLIKTDQMRLIQVLSNLLNNAIKFTEQGEVTLLIDCAGQKDDNVLVRFTVKDTGIGIARDKQNLLFEAFSQADISMTRQYGGSGLGLSICQQIVKLLGGEITLTSDIDKGCEFSFILPFSLPKQNAEKSKDTSYDINSLRICTIGQNLSASLIETIKSYGWQYQQYASLTEFTQQNQAVEADSTVVLLIDEVRLASQLYQVESPKIAWQKMVSLVALCQSAMQEISSNTCQYLHNLSMPHILLDTPLYRYALTQITTALTGVSISATEQIPPNFKNTATTKEPELPHVSVQNNVKTCSDLAGINVLLVEDNLVNQLVAKELLLSMQAKVMIAENGQQALDLLADNHFDVVLMDIQMPVMDGLTATRMFRKQEQSLQQETSTPIIAMTAHAREEDEQQSLFAGMNLHIAKPVTCDVLRESILQVTGG
jgi:signal transduction histidine kinase